MNGRMRRKMFNDKEKLDYENREIKEIYLIGNGPSLKNVDMSLLKDVETICFNRSYISYDEWGFDPTYYMAIDPGLVCSTIDDINDLINNNKNIKKFFFSSKKDIRPQIKCDTTNDIVKDPRVKLYDMKGVSFYKDKKVSYMGTVGLCSIQILHEMGYNRIYLLGCDMKYTPKIKNVKKSGNFLTSTTDNDDPNHYRSDYFKSGIQYGSPNNSALLNRWKTSSLIFKKLKIDVISLTPDSELNKFLPFEENDFYKK